MRHLPLSLSENLDYEREEEEQLASEGTDFLDEHKTPNANSYTAQRFGTSGDLERRNPVALPSTTSTSSTASDTPTLTVQCGKEGFQIALHAGRLSDVHVRGMCQGASKCKTTTTTLQNLYKTN